MQPGRSRPCNEPPRLNRCLGRVTSGAPTSTREPPPRLRAASPRSSGPCAETFWQAAVHFHQNATTRFEPPPWCRLQVTSTRLQAQVAESKLPPPPQPLLNRFCCVLSRSRVMAARSTVSIVAVSSSRRHSTSVTADFARPQPVPLLISVLSRPCCHLAPPSPERPHSEPPVSVKAAAELMSRRSSPHRFAGYR